MADKAKNGKDEKPAKEKKEEKPKETVDELLAKLKTTEDQGEKRNIRARLRTLGHNGGLGKREKKVKEPKAKAKGKRAKAADAE